MVSQSYEDGSPHGYEVCEEQNEVSRGFQDGSPHGYEVSRWFQEQFSYSCKNVAQLNSHMCH